MATIRQRNSRWQAIVKRQGYPTQSKTFALRKDAEKWPDNKNGLSMPDNGLMHQTTGKSCCQTFLTATRGRSAPTSEAIAPNLTESKHSKN
jgi:hypothetical protein